MATPNVSVASASLTAFAVGTAAFWGYFHRAECHMHAFTYLNSFLVSYVALAVYLCKVSLLDIPSAAALSTSAAAAFLAGAYGNCMIFRLFLNPLNSFPGPYSARISDLWLSTQLGNSDGFYWLQKMHKKHGKFLRIGSNSLSIIDPDAMELSYGAKSKVTKAIWYDNDKPLTSMHTSRDRGLHDRRRRVWAPAFSEKALRDYETEIQKLNTKLVDQIGKHNGKPVNVTKWFNLFSFDAMGLLAFGRDYGMLDTGEKRHELEMLDEGMQPLAYRLPSWFFRMLTKIPGLSAGYQKFVNFCINELTWRVKHAEEKKRDTDIMGWLLKAYKDVPNPEADTMLQADARLIIVAGSDTTAATLTYLFFHLASNPDQVRKLRGEVDAKTQGEWQESDIRTCNHLNGCINEALRLHPPVPSGVNRLTPPEGMKVGDTWVPGNVTFITPQYVMGRDERIYAEADSFVPERWYSQEDKIKHKDAFAPFSMGPYGCIGKNLAFMELRTLTTRLIQTFDIKLAPNEDGFRLLNKTKDHFTVDLGDVEIVFTPRA
ncbi:Cytochrome P450 monooxygenase [Fulvia fulva]|uniref:Cytochrome P450 monooxygenase n=1 Tax=Passalora fulva TaxID=5499 RepID=A0A9Q8UR97_PASFU|nr:Cytochrome P450 monooxygenase [Fulvia fulva]KAK4622300.1 Cytochrome P450 monooxygenase [Fulvia fulva]KAK4623056.1 Cytochrome P450 monooxygenase [Fulvia fulva]UJO19482.1 Cytochrome P450 monooxygenase [Fulvia fulva]WPV15730.1 Cytochrome P450 monooxygenase [Fulvia fulva]WPV30935.1 Cytochrome P450 monooxygenase [Fulvia fulva]